MKNIFNSIYFFVLIILLILSSRLSDAIPPELQNLSYAIYTTSPTYNTDRFNFNKRFNIFPQAIFVPTTETEIIYVFGVLKKYNLPFAIRSGGHCYEPGSLSPNYIIDLSGFNLIIPDISNSSVSIGAGVLLGDIINTLGALNYAIPVGTCPSNCITGFTLGGGLGLLGRLYGIACDSVQSIRLLTAESTIIDVTATSNPDLFWALRGGGNGSYGIVIGFTYTMYYIPVVTYYKLSWGWSPATFNKVFKRWQNWVLTLPNNISSIVRLSYESGKIVFDINGLKVGSQPFTEWQSAFADLNPNVSITQESYLESSLSWATQPSIPFNKGKSKIMMRPLSNKVINQIAKYFEQLLHDKAALSVLFDFEAFGGVIPNSNSSFFPKNAFGWWYQAVYWSLQEQTEQALNYSRTFYNKISPNTSIYAYSNTTDYDLGPYFLNAYYGDNSTRLMQVKNAVDPENIFNWTQSIPLPKPVPGSLISQ